MGKQARHSLQCRVPVPGLAVWAGGFRAVLTLGGLLCGLVSLNWLLL